jgi:hypothetical protein
VANGSSRRVTSGQRMVACAALQDVGNFGQDEAFAWVDALAVAVEDGQEDAPRVLLSRLVDEVTAERVRAALLGNLRPSERSFADRVDELFQTMAAVPDGELPSWAQSGIQSPTGYLAYSRLTLDLDAEEEVDGRPWPPITVMVHQLAGADATVVFEVGPAGVPCSVLPRQARTVAAALTSAADLAEQVKA